jgi:hypothetical protein
VVEVRYDYYMEGARLTAQSCAGARTGEPESCTYEQLEQPVTFDLVEVRA